MAIFGMTNHSLLPGEQVSEELRLSGRHGRIRWTVRERKAPTHWLLDGILEQPKVKGTMTYTLTADGRGTRFRRDLVYSGLNAVVDRLIVRPTLEAEFKEALKRLKQSIETG